MSNHDEGNAAGSGPKTNGLAIAAIAIVLGGGAWLLANSGADAPKAQATNSADKPAADTKPAAPAAAPAAPAAPAAAANAAVKGPDRSFTELQRESLLQRLNAEMGDVKKVWLQVTQGDTEADRFRAELEKLFKQAGWQVTTMPPAKARFKPGIFFFIAEEGDPPTYINSALAALKAADLTVMDASGYRSFYQEKKKENPSWVGVEMGADQTYAVVIGPKP